jgi:hypothetical protein
MKSARNLFAIALAQMVLATTARATGYYGPEEYLDNGGANVDASPEFYWELEVKRLAGAFHPPEKLVEAPMPKETTDTDDATKKARNDFTTDVDVKDFAQALKEGRMKPPDPAKATQQHETARKLIEVASDGSSGTPPEEFPSEFADYHRGALAYRDGKAHWEEARQAWEALLQRPEQERHYRTVWAAFMLGKLALKNSDPEAVKWFEQTRDLAKAGFTDSLGMAADSYGWQGRSEWKQNHPEKAAPLFLTQLALGDESAIVSLKALIPDRAPISGMLNYGPEAEDMQSWTADQKRDAEEKNKRALQAAARDPLLRRLVTAHILATESTHDFSGEDVSAAAPTTNRCARWLTVIKEAKLDRIDDAEYLGWVAYNSGDYKGAAHWLEMAQGQSPAACWLRAKLQRRAGKLADATRSMDQAWQSIHDIATYTGLTPPPPRPVQEENSYTYSEGPRWPFNESAGGDLAGLRLVSAEFVSALDTFLKAGLWNDGSFVAERILTADELKSYVDQHPNFPTTPNSTAEASTERLRYLLARRLVREDRYDEAARYIKPPYDKVLEKYVKSLKDGANEKLPKAERARAWFTAAWLARYDGMEIMGTEVTPDGFAEGGSFPFPDLAKERRTGMYTKIRYVDGKEKTDHLPIALKASKQEVQRLAKNKIAPDLRFHYRVVAGEIAMKAAKLLPDNSEELADVVNTAGNWVKDRDEPTGNLYFKILEQRCVGTKIGRAATAKHWFVDEQGAWSQQQDEAHQAMLKELKLDGSQ